MRDHHSFSTLDKSAPPRYFHSTANSSRPIGLLFDVDNFILSRSASRGRLNIALLDSHIAEANASVKIAYGGYFYPKEAARLNSIGIKTVATGGNADLEIIAKARRLMAHNFDVVVLSGDGDLAKSIIEAAKSCGAQASFWSLRSKASKQVTFSKYIDDSIEPQRRVNDWTWLNRRLAQQGSSSEARA